MNNKKSGTLFIIAAPSGAGKTSLVKALAEQSDELAVSVSHTTRQARADEENGRDYYFIDETDFKKRVNANEFLEYAKVFGNYYGTSREAVETQLASGKNIILEIDWQGAEQVKSQLRNCVSIFVLPPDYKTLRDRLISRQKDAMETIEQRMAAAENEISHYKDFDYIVINDNFETALSELKMIITATNLGTCRQSDFYDDFVGQIMAQKD